MLNSAIRVIDITGDIDTTAVEQSQKNTEYKSISAGQLYQNVWKNPLTDIPKDTKREQNYSNIFNPPRFTVYRQPSIKHGHILRKNPLANIPKDTDREQIYSKIVNLQCSYDSLQRIFHKLPTPFQSSST